MMRSCAAAALLVALLLPAAPGHTQVSRPAADEKFSFYGLRFGMGREEIKKLRRTSPDGAEIIDPGHGMISLYLAYDYLDRLAEIRASYERPSERLREQALRQALRERFLQQLGSRWRDVSGDIDEYFNRAALTLVLVATDLRQAEIDHYRDQYLKGLE
jgi:hypothetical protein